MIDEPVTRGAAKLDVFVDGDALDHRELEAPASITSSSSRAMSVARPASPTGTSYNALTMPRTPGICLMCASGMGSPAPNQRNVIRTAVYRVSRNTAGFHPPSTAAGVYRFASPAVSVRRVRALHRARPLRPELDEARRDGSYQMRVPVESTDDMRSHPCSPMWSSIQQSMNATALFTARVRERVPRPAERDRAAAMRGALFLQAAVHEQKAERLIALRYSAR